MKKICAILLLALTACDATEDSANRVGHGLRENYDTSRKHLSKWIYRWNGEETSPPPPATIANAYCYNVRADILCYEQPRENLGSRLVGYQGSTAYPDGAGYVANAGVADTSSFSGGEITSHDVPAPFYPASDETMARVGGGYARGGGSGGGSTDVYSPPTPHQAGVPTTLMPQ